MNAAPASPVTKARVKKKRSAGLRHVGSLLGGALLGTSIDHHSLWISAVVSACLLPISYLYFKRIEATVADVV